MLITKSTFEHLILTILQRDSRNLARRRGQIGDWATLYITAATFFLCTV